MTLEELCKRLEELTRECDRIALEIVQRRGQKQAIVRIAQQSEALGEYDKFTSC